LTWDADDERESSYKQGRILALVGVGGDAYSLMKEFLCGL